MTPVEIRPIAPSDYQAVADLTVSVYGEVLGSVLSDDYRAELADVADRVEHALVLVAVDGAGLVVGSVTYVSGPGPYATFESDDEAGIRMLVVAKDLQRMGVGSALVRACLERAREERKVCVSLHTTAAMTAAQRLYEGLGFRRAPERDWPLEAGPLLMAYVLDL